MQLTGLCSSLAGNRMHLLGPHVARPSGESGDTSIGPTRASAGGRAWGNARSPPNPRRRRPTDAQTCAGLGGSASRIWAGGRRPCGCLRGRRACAPRTGGGRCGALRAPESAQARNGVRRVHSGPVAARAAVAAKLFVYRATWRSSSGPARTRRCEGRTADAPSIKRPVGRLAGRLMQPGLC